MEPLYNIYFSGELLEGQELSAVRQNFARLFNANEATLEKLFSGMPQLLKRDCDKATAMKYKQAMEKAGGRPVIKTIEESTAGQQASPEPPPKALSAAEKIAALAAAPDETEYRSEPAPEAEAPQQAAEDTSPAASDDIVLAAEGTEVLKPEERATPIVNDIDTSGLDIDASAQRLSAEPPPPPPSPDTGHLSMGEVGDDIPTLPSDLEPLSPNTDALNLSPEGTDFSDCAAPEPETPELDLSGLDVAPQGSDVLEDKYRDKEQHQAPATDHISLEN